MARYALLVLPSANRVYADASVALTLAELQVFNGSVLDGRLARPEPATIGGVPYVTFEADALRERDLAHLANLSSRFALFELEDGRLRPVELHPLDRFDDDLLTVQKYQGKTNEHFTKLLLNVTVLSSASAGDMLDRRLTVLDPLCGRGTTLNQALMYGYDASGMDLDQRDVEAYATFVQTWLKRKRLKHRAEYGPVRRHKQVVARRLHVELAATKEDYRAGDVQVLEVVHADTTRAADFFRPETFDVVVTDAPYGVQHGSRTAAGLARSPADLVAAAAPVWAGLLRPGGAMGIAFNAFVLGRDEGARILADAGLEVLDAAAYRGFEHRVDQAIRRDVLVARKP